MINSLSEQLPLKTIGIVLTDDYYTYLGIASLFEDGKCFMFPLNGEYNSCQISASEDIIIIIDGRVLIQGSGKVLRRSCSIIHMLVESGSRAEILKTLSTWLR